MLDTISFRGDSEADKGHLRGTELTQKPGCLAELREQNMNARIAPMKEEIELPGSQSPGSR